MVVCKYDGDVTTREVGTNGVINGRFVTNDTGDTVKLAGAGDQVVGVANGGKVNNHDGTAADPYQAGDSIAIRHRGIVVVEAGANGVVMGDLVKAAANGKAQPFDPANDTVDLIAGRAMTSGNSGDDVEVLLI